MLVMTKQWFERVKERRLELELTPDGLAKKAGLSRPAVLNIEDGRVKFPRRDTILALAEALEMSEAEIYGEDAAAYLAPELEERAVRIMRMVPSNRLHQFENLTRVWVGLDEHHQGLLADIGRLFITEQESRPPKTLGRKPVRLHEDQADYEAKEE